MPEPISRSVSPSVNTGVDPYSDDVGQMSRAESPNSSQAEPQIASSAAEPPAPSSPAVPKLVSSVPPPPSVLPPTGSTANSNAQRTSQRVGVAPYADAGVTTAENSAYAGVAVVKGRDPKSGVDVEALSASVQIGAQSEVQVGLQRVAGSRGALTGSVETFTARANVGVYNDDGSKGLNVGACATAIGFEGTIGGDSSLTYGVAASAGAAGSVGVRDLDRDGKTELCARLSLGPVTLGLCMEDPR
jgi:hypothetical protein